MSPRLRTAILPALTLAATLGSSGIVEAQHIHNNHPIAPHGGDWVLWDLKSDWVGPMTVVLNAKVVVPLFNQRFINDTCDPMDAEVSVSVNKTHSVSVSALPIGGSANAAALALANAVKAKAHANVTIGGGGTTWTQVVTYAIQSQAQLPKCTIKDFNASITQYKASGSVTTADHRLVCKKQSTGAKAVNYCNKLKITSSGVGYDNLVTTWTNVGPVVPCPCDEDPDPEDPVPEVEEEEEEPSDPPGGGGPPPATEEETTDIN